MLQDVKTQMQAVEEAARQRRLWVLAQFNAGKTPKELAAEMRVTVSRIYFMLQKANYKSAANVAIREQMRLARLAAKPEA